MGQTLSEPVIDKHTSTGEDDTLIYGISEMQGWRISMEDAHATVLNLDEKTGEEKASFFAVYDGHGGSTVAKFTGETLHGRLAASEEYKSGKYEAALKRAFLATDEDLRANPSFSNDPSGCTAVAALLVADQKSDGASDSEKVRKIIVANAGDSRSVLSLSGMAKPMSYDHKPGNRTENARIVSAGGFVEFGRVNGNLALSRAIGDFEFKQNFSLEPEEQIVTADPEIIQHTITGEEEFLVLACDGIWDCLSNQQVVDFVRRGIANGKELKVICEEGMDRCLAPDSEIGGVGCDNMTLCVVALLGGRTKKEWYEWVKQRVDSQVGWDTPEDIAPVFNVQATSSSRGGGNNESQGGDDLLTQYMRKNNMASYNNMVRAGVISGDDDEEGEGGGGTLRLSESMAGALGGAGIVFRPGSQTDEDGDVVYEAHIVDKDEDEEMDTAKVQELVEKGQIEAEKRDASSSQETAPRPDLSHQAEIVTNPPPPKAQGIEIRPSTEGKGALAQEKQTTGAGSAELTDKSEDPTKLS